MGHHQEDRRMLGAMLRIPFQATVARIYEGLLASGFTDLRPAHFVVFQHIQPEGSRITDLAEQAQITKQSMGALIHYLVDYGYLERAPDPEDGRAKIVRLTDQGWSLDAAARKIMSEIETEWAEKLGEERWAEFKQTLQELNAFIAE